MVLDNKFNISDLDLLRVFALLIVVLRHSFAPYMGGMWGLDDFYESSYNAKIIGKYVSTVSMPLYVFISGVLFSYLRNYLKKYQNYKVLIQKKVKRLIRPYIILAPLYLIFFTEANSFLEHLLGLWEGAGHLWFLLMIFTVFLIFYPFENYFKNNITKGFIIFSGLYCIYHLIHFYTFSAAIVLSLKYMPFFYIGYMYYYKSEIVLNFLKNKAMLLFLLHAVLFIATYIIIPKYIAGTRLYVVISKLIFLPMGITSISFLFIVFSKMKFNLSKKSHKIIKNINTNSYYVYILHQPFLILIFKLNFLRNWNEVSLILVSFLCVFLISLVLSNLIMKFKIGRKLIGAY